MSRGPGNRGNGRAGTGPTGRAGRGPGRRSKPCGLLVLALPVLVVYALARQVPERVAIAAASNAVLCGLITLAVGLPQF